MRANKFHLHICCFSLNIFSKNIQIKNTKIIIKNKAIFEVIKLCQGDS